MKIYFLGVFSSLLAIVPEQAGTLKAGSNGCNKEKILMISRKFPHTSNNDHEAIFGDRLGTAGTGRGVTTIFFSDKLKEQNLVCAKTGDKQLVIVNCHAPWPV